MGWRVTDGEVRDHAELAATVPLTNHIRLANRLTDKVDAKDTGDLLTDEDLYGIELNLAAHFAVQHERNQQFTSRSTEGASGSFQGQFGEMLKSSHYGQNALMLDETGFLQSLGRGMTKVSATWIGKPVSDQIDYEDRD